MNALTLPGPIATYFAADPQDTDGWARCFTTQAVVKDEGHIYAGLDAIKAWKAAAFTKYSYSTAPFALEQKNGHHIVSSHVEGNFPGSPVDLRYHFRLEGGLIASLEIGA